MAEPQRLTHLGAAGEANMVDVGDKAETDAHGDRRGRVSRCSPRRCR